jgi:hypothetical protein
MVQAPVEGNLKISTKATAIPRTASAARTTLRFIAPFVRLKRSFA